MRIPFIDGMLEDEMLCNKGVAKMKKIFLIFLMLIGTSEVVADTWGPGTGHTITNIRAYPDGSLVFQFAPSLEPIQYLFAIKERIG